MGQSPQQQAGAHTVTRRLTASSAECFRAQKELAFFLWSRSQLWDAAPRNKNDLFFCFFFSRYVFVASVANGRRVIPLDVDSPLMGDASDAPVGRPVGQIPPPVACQRANVSTDGGAFSWLVFQGTPIHVLQGSIPHYPIWLQNRSNNGEWKCKGF